MAEEPRDTAIALGAFDAIHLGHQRIIEETNAPAARGNLRRLVVTFEPHPRGVLGGEAPARLTTVEERARLVALLGEGPLAPSLHVLRFDEALANTTARDFAKMLRDDLRVRFIVIGENFHFGRGREGDCRRLAEFGAELGFEVVTLGLEASHGETISSSRIRALLQAGDVRGARELLGRSYALNGVVEHGLERGRTIGYPTANLGTIETLLPKDGVYSARVVLETQRAFGAVVNIGMRPTVASGLARTVEAHLFGFNEDLYGRPLRLEFVTRIRDEQKFESFDALKAQIDEDAARARAILEKL